MTNDKEALFAKFIDYLQSEQTPPEYLGEPPESANSFDPYQMVAEWIALRHEVKQQGKLLRSAQDVLQSALSATRSEKEQIILRLEESQKQASNQFDQQQEKLLRDLLGIMDALDRACVYWEEELQTLSVKSTPQKGFWQQLLEGFAPGNTQSTKPESSLREILTSNQQGVELIRRSLLEVLRQRRVVPIEAYLKPFDSQTMYAVGRQSRTDVADNIVIQEVVRGYLWGDRVLREAQVMVASRYSEAEETTNK